MLLQMLKNRKSISIIGVLTLLILAITAPPFSAGAKKLPQLKTPSNIVVTAVLPVGDFTVSWSPVANTDSYTVRVYSAAGKSLVRTIPSAISGETVTALQSNTPYRVTVQAIGNGIAFSSSPESGKYSVTTFAAFYAITWDSQTATTFSASGGSETYTTGSSVDYIPTTNPLKAGYDFLEWNTASDGTGTPVTAGYTPISPYGNKTFYAKWRLAAPAFTLTPTIDTATVGTPFTSPTPASTGGAISEYSIIGGGLNPGPSNGLSFDTSTGIISGTPVESATSINFTITAYNATDSATASFELIILAAQFTSAQTPIIVETGTSVAAETVTVGVEVRADSYTVTGITTPGITYIFQWETSTAINGTYTEIPGTTNETFTATPDLDDFYLRVVVTANATGYTETSTASTGLLVFAAAPTQEFAIGDPGPGGGIIYYYDSAGFNCGVTFTNTGSPSSGLCHYLEVAPDGWKGSAGDPTKVWAVTANQGGDITGIANENPEYNNASGIGLGYKNSDLIVTQNGSTYNASTNNYAAGAARAYAGGSKSDWYLPTTAELNLLCQWDRGVTQDVTIRCTGGAINTGTGAGSAAFLADNYWSSSEYGANYAWPQYLSTGQQGYNMFKSDSHYVRPIRAF